MALERTLERADDRRAAVRAGLFGAGAFGRYLLQTLAASDKFRFVAVASRRPETAKQAAADFKVSRVCESFEELAHAADVDVIVIASPPYLHAEQAVAALENGKDVIVEKPLATSPALAESIAQAAHRSGRLFAVDFPMPYTAIVKALKALVESGAVGTPNRIDVENITSCEGLHDDHWFWDRTKSGGILIEHGVHFFDWCGALLGKPQQVSGWAAERNSRQDRVFAAVAHEGGALATYYHAFIVTAEEERTSIRIAFDAVDAIVGGWIPTTLRLCGAAASRAAGEVRRLQEPGLREASPLDREAGDGCYSFEAGAKADAYAAATREEFADIALAHQDAGHRPLIGAQRILTGLQVASAASESAASGRRVSIG